MTSYNKILVTTDFSPHALTAVQHAASLARRLEAELVLLYVVPDDLPPVLVGVTEERRGEILEEHREKAAASLEDYAAEHLAGTRVKTLVKVGLPARRIVQTAGEERADLIVMASRGYGPLRQVLLGSTTERVLHRTDRPVLVVRDGTMEGDGERDESEDEGFRGGARPAGAD